MAPPLAPAGVLTLEALRALPPGDVTDAVMGRPWAWRTPGWRGARPTVLAIDPGSTSGWAWIDGLDYKGGARDWSAPWFAAELAKRSPAIVVVEDSYLGNNALTFQRLAWNVGAVRGLVETAGCRCVRVSPPTWQSVMLGGKRERESGKARSLDIAKRRVSGLVRSDHESDAALMALWVLVGG